jgi:tRNA dimethylallyltransferase
VADGLGGEVVSADSMQAYRGLPILTAQPERPTRLVGIWPLSHEGSVAEYARLAHREIDELLDRGRTPVVAGGTGLYLRAALAELELPPAPTPERRAHWERLYERVGGDRAHELLADRDAAAASRLHPNDRRRIVRALELTELGASLRPDADRLWSDRTRHPTLIFGLDVPRKLLVDRIERRVGAMFAAGLDDEVREALAGPVSSTAIHALGLRDVAELSQSDAMDALIRRTTRYAAYQRKWMRRIPGLIPLDASRPPEVVAERVIRILERRRAELARA